MALIYGGKKLSGFYPNCAEGRNPFSFRKYDWFTFGNIGEIELFLDHIHNSFQKKSYSLTANKIQKGLRFLDL